MSGMKEVQYRGKGYSFETVREREERLKKVALDLFDKCKGENLTIYEFEKVLEILDAHAKSTVIIQGRRDA